MEKKIINIGSCNIIFNPPEEEKKTFWRIEVKNDYEEVTLVIWIKKRKLTKTQMNYIVDCILNGMYPTLIRKLIKAKFPFNQVSVN